MEEMILEKINLKIEKLKTKIKPSYTKSIDKASNNFAFICKKFFIPKIISEVGEYNIIQSNSTYSKVNFSKNDIIKNNENYCQKTDLILADKNRSRPIIYWLPKLHKTPTGARSIIASKNCSTKPLSGEISKIFKILFKHAENFHNFPGYKKFGLWRIFFLLLKN